MTRIVFRCDASLSIGSGHVMRCRTLARELQMRGAQITFLCRRQRGNLIGLLEQEFEVLGLPELPLAPDQMPDGQPLEGRALYRTWLGCSQDQDAVDCLEALHAAGRREVQWLVVDHYGLDASWHCLVLEGLGRNPEAAAGTKVPRLLVIDDLADRPHQADLLLDQNFFGEATHQRYQELLPPECTQLLGPHYALLGPEYSQLHPLVPARTELRRVLVFFGGVDAANLTGKALEALMDPELAHLAVDVVLGLQSPHRHSVQELVSRRPYTTLHDPLPTLAGLIVRADLAIGAGGATTWERACLGLPSLVVAIAANQWPFTEALDQAGHLQLIASSATVNAGAIRQALLAALQQPLPLASGRSLSDGWGAARMAAAMLGARGPLRLRQANAMDEDLLLRWANDPQVRAQSFSSESISSDQHNSWFKAGLDSPNRLHLIASDSAGLPVGQIRFDRQPISPRSVSREAAIDLSLDRCFRGLKLAGELVRQGLQAMELHWGPGTEAVAEVLTGNQASQATFARAGFVADGAVDSTRVSAIPPPVSECNALALAPSRISLLSDPSSWLNDYLPQLIEALWQRGHALRWIHTPNELRPGDVCLLLSCGRLLSSEQLAFHRHNLVVHESALPEGQGWSPMTWQILEGASSIPITLFEATAALDAGPIYLQQQIALQGHELMEEWRVLQAQATLALCLAWFVRYQEVVNAVQPQHGEASHYRRRQPADSQLDPERSLAEQFNLLRVVDNQRYPAFFEIESECYNIYIKRFNHG